MKKKFMLFCFIMLTMCFLSGCGKAEVASELKFNSDGSGSRSVYVTIKEDDVSSIKGGLNGIDALLKSAAPNGVTVRRTNADNGDAVYQFTFFFDNIKQYNEKIYQITGKEHNATWYTENSVFLSNVEFTEDECTTELITWAIDAIKGKLGGWIPSNLNNYEVTKNEVYYNDELQFSGTGDPSFVIQVAPKVEKASVMTTYSFDGNEKKVIEIQFEKGSLERVNLTDAKEVLSAYSESYSFDRANDIIKYELTGDQINEFLKVADLTVTDDKNMYSVIKNPFQQKYEITASYNLGQFFSMFDMSNALYIYDYVKLPTVMNDVEASHTDSLGNIAVPEDYDYAGAFRYDDTYAASFKGDQMIDLSSITVSYNVSKELTVKRQIDVAYEKNGCEISEDEMKEYYKDYKDNISISDNGDSIKVTFILTRKCGDDYSKETDILSSIRTSRGLKYRYYDVTDGLDITRYLPYIEGYKWNSESIKYDYRIEIEKDAGVKGITVGNLDLAGNKDLGTVEAEEGYVLSGTQTANEQLSINVYCKQMFNLFYLLVIVFVFIVITAGLVAILIFMKKEKIIESEDYDDLEGL